jgi:hypothetical protein
MVGGDHVFKNYKRIVLKTLVNAKKFNAITAANNALPKCGQTMELQQQQRCRFGLGAEPFFF